MVWFGSCLSDWNRIGLYMCDLCLLVLLLFLEVYYLHPKQNLHSSHGTRFKKIMFFFSENVHLISSSVLYSCCDMSSCLCYTRSNQIFIIIGDPLPHHVCVMVKGGRFSPHTYILIDSGYVLFLTGQTSKNK